MGSLGSLGRSTRRALVVLLAAALSLVALGALAAAPALAATTLNVSTTTDTSQAAGACSNTGLETPPSPLSLREAVCLANNIGGEVNINLPAGTYKLANGELKIGTHSGQTVNLTGAASASTVIDAQHLSRVIDIDSALTSGIKTVFTGVTIANGKDDTFGGAGILDGYESGSAIDTLTLQSVVVENCIANEAHPTTTNKPGGGVAMDSGKLTIEDSKIVGNKSFSSSGGGVSFYNNLNGAAGQGMFVKNTIFESNNETGSAVNAPVGGALYVDAGTGQFEVTESRFANNTSVSTASGGARGAGIYFEVVPKGVVTRTSFTGNTVSGNGALRGSAVDVEPNGVASGNEKIAPSVAIHYNRIFGNTPSAAAVSNTSSTETIANVSVNASENWWGCNSEPGTGGCDGASGTGTVTKTPYLKFNASASPSTVIGPNGTSTLTASFSVDSNGVAVSPAEIGNLGGTEATWKEPTPSGARINGMVSTKTPFSAGSATATFNSYNSVGAGHAVATLDNATVTMPITVYQKPTISSNPPNQPGLTSPGYTMTYTVSGHGTPTPTVQWERSTDGGTSFTPIPGATASTYSFTAGHGESGYQFRATFTNTIEGMTYTATSTSATLTYHLQTTSVFPNFATRATMGGAVSDKAVLAYGNLPTGSLTFSAYGPDDPTCATTPAFNGTVTVSGNGTYQSPDFTPTSAGEYRWSVSYSGDDADKPSTSVCATNEYGSSIAYKRAATLAAGSSSGVLGGTIHDSATLGGGFAPGGTITFKAFGPDDPGCANGPVFSKSVAVSGNGGYGSTDFTPADAGTYNWTAEYSGDGNNEGTTSVCGSEGETSQVAKASPTLSTAATDATIGAAIHDTATLAAGVTPGGTITFRAFGPNDATCANAAAFTGTATVNANGEHGSGDFTATALGEYNWTAEYSGDANNNAVASSCNESGETSSVTQAEPAISTTATGATIGEPIHGTATLTGSHVATGSIEFKAFAAGDTMCTSAPVFTKSVAVNGDGSYGSTDFTPTALGDYRWTAEYSGDTDNKAAASLCSASGDSSTVVRAEPTLSASATDAAIGSAAHDTATIADGYYASGALEFKVFDVGDSTCTGTPDFTETVPVNGAGAYRSDVAAEFTPAALGEYRWTVAYTGDTDNAPATSACNAANETSTVSQAEPALTATANATAAIGGAIHGTATLASGTAPSGTITFQAFGPNDATCAGAPAYAKTVTVTGNGTYESGDFTPAAAGVYRWVASYSGDANNAPAAGQCGDAGETSTVSALPSPVNPPAPVPAPTPPALCTAPPSATADGYVPAKKVPTGFVPGVRVRIAVAKPSDLQIGGTLKYTLNGKTHTAELGSVLLENPGTRNLHLALPSGLRENLPLGTGVRLLLQIAAAPAADSPCATPRQRKLTFKTEVVDVLAQR
jgi:hypothetical protein